MSFGITQTHGMMVCVYDNHGAPSDHRDLGMNSVGAWMWKRLAKDSMNTKEMGHDDWIHLISYSGGSGKNLFLIWKKDGPILRLRFNGSKEWEVLEEKGVTWVTLRNFWLTEILHEQQLPIVPVPAPQHPPIILNKGQAQCLSHILTATIPIVQDATNFEWRVSHDGTATFFAKELRVK